MITAAIMARGAKATENDGGGEMYDAANTPAGQPDYEVARNSRACILGTSSSGVSLVLAALMLCIVSSWNRKRRKSSALAMTIQDSHATSTGRAARRRAGLRRRRKRSGCEADKEWRGGSKHRERAATLAMSAFLIGALLLCGARNGGGYLAEARADDGKRILDTGLTVTLRQHTEASVVPDLSRADGNVHATADPRRARGHAVSLAWAGLEVSNAEAERRWCRYTPVPRRLAQAAVGTPRFDPRPGRRNVTRTSAEARGAAVRHWCRYTPALRLPARAAVGAPRTDHCPSSCRHEWTSGYRMERRHELGDAHPLMQTDLPGDAARAGGGCLDRSRWAVVAGPVSRSRTTGDLTEFVADLYSQVASSRGNHQRPIVTECANAMLALILCEGVSVCADERARGVGSRRLRVVLAAYVVGGMRMSRRRAGGTARAMKEYFIAMATHGAFCYSDDHIREGWCQACCRGDGPHFRGQRRGTILFRRGCNEPSAGSLRGKRPVSYDGRSPPRSSHHVVCEGLAAGRSSGPYYGAVLGQTHSTPTPLCRFLRSGLGQVGKSRLHHEKEDRNRDVKNRVDDKEDRDWDLQKQEEQDQRTLPFGRGRPPSSSSPSSLPDRTDIDGDPTQEGGFSDAARPRKNTTGGPLHRKEKRAHDEENKAVGKGRGFFTDCGPTHGDITIRSGHEHGVGVADDGDFDGNDVDEDPGDDDGCSDGEGKMYRWTPPPSLHPRPPGRRKGRGYGHAGGAQCAKGDDESSARRQGARASIVQVDEARGEITIAADNNHDANGGWNGGWNACNGGRPRPRPHGLQHPSPPRKKRRLHTKRQQHRYDSTSHDRHRQHNGKCDVRRNPVDEDDMCDELIVSPYVSCTWSSSKLNNLNRHEHHNSSVREKSVALGRGRKPCGAATSSSRGRRTYGYDADYGAANDNADDAAAGYHEFLNGAEDDAAFYADAPARDQPDHDHDGDDNGARDVPEGDRGGIMYIGIVSMLDLRGGGVQGEPARDNGAGVLGWLDDEADDADQAYQREQRRRLELELIDDELEETRAAQPQRQRRPQPMVTGMQGEVPVIVCGGCMSDVPIRDLTWRQCGCDAFRCSVCAQRQCPTCGVRAVQRSGTPQDMEYGSERVTEHIGEWASAAPEAWDYQAASWFAWDCATDQAVADPAPSALTCASCLVGSRARQGNWSICHCGLTYCVECAAWGCPECGGLRAHLPRSGDQPSLDAEDDDDARTLAPESINVDDDDFDMPPILSPQQALARREAVLDKHRLHLREKRRHSHRLEKKQSKEGRRPRRQRDNGQAVTFATVNATSPQRLKDELTGRGELAGCDFVAAQEVGMHGELAGQASDWLQRHHWTGVIDPPYRKHSGYGGGTAVVSRHPSGIRRACHSAKLLRGRLTTGVTQVSSSITVASFYGVSGASLAVQVPYWRELADILICLARPFVVCGDWQRPPTSCETRACAKCWTLR